MFFILSKILSFIIQPIMWLMSALGWAFFTKNKEKKGKILRGVFFLSIALTNPFLMHQTFRFYETPAVSMSDVRDTFDIGIVLGGFSKFDGLAADRLNFNRASNRLMDAVILYKKGLIRKILISGGDGNLLSSDNLEAAKTEPFLRELGVRQADILLENRSRNTHENALFSKQLIDNQLFTHAKIIMITSAYHMPRAMGCFRKVGLDVLPFPAHFIGEKPSWNAHYWLKPDADAFANWEMIFKEWVGYGVYVLKGYI